MMYVCVCVRVICVFVCVCTPAHTYKHRSCDRQGWIDIRTTAGECAFPSDRAITGAVPYGGHGLRAPLLHVDGGSGGSAVGDDKNPVRILLTRARGTV